VADLPKAVLLGNGICPTFHGRSGDLNRTTTAAADQMMMVTGRTAAIRSLTVIGADNVKITCIGHELQRPVDRGEADTFAVMAQIIVNLLGCSKIMAVRQDLLDSCTLPGPTLST
jgi:hypothetical protein